MPTGDEYLAKYRELGSKNAVAKFYKRDIKTVWTAIDRALKRENLSPGIISALEQTGLNPEHATHGWRRVKDPETGSFNSVFWKAPSDAVDSFFDRISEVFKDLPAAPVVEMPAHKDADLMTLLPIADAHLGLMAWGREAGEDWDTAKAAKRLTNWAARTLQGLPNSSCCVILIAGDLLHADDNRGETPASKHRLDTDTRHFKTLEVTIEALALVVGFAAERHETVVLRILPGNHDPHASMAVMFAMAERYRYNPRVRVKREPSEFFVQKFGKVLVAAHHGHRAKAPRMVEFVADEFAALWGQTRFRYLFTGHLHHHKSQDIGGMLWEQLPSIAARDVYTTSNAYVARARMVGITYHRERGEIARVVTGVDLDD